MPAIIAVEPGFNTQAAERGYEIVLGEHQHIEHVVQSVELLTRLTRGLADGRREERAELIEKRDEFSRQIWLMERAWEDGEHRLEADEKKIARWRESIRKINRRLAELDAVQPEPIFHMDVLSRFFAGVREHHRFTRVAPANIPSDPAKAEREITKTLESRAALLRQNRNWEIGPLPVDDGVTKMLAENRKAAREGEPNISALLRMPKDIVGRRRQGSIRFKEGRDGRPDPLALLRWACEEIIGEKLKAMLRAEAERHGSPLPWASRQPLIEANNAKVRELEYREQALIQVLEAAGRTDIQRRPDSNPLVVLMLERAPDAERAAEPEPDYAGGDGPQYGFPLSAEESAGWHVGSAGAKR